MWKVSAVVAAVAVAVVSGQDCNYVLMNEAGDGEDPDYVAYSLGSCQSIDSADSKVSQKYTCSDDDQKVEVTSYTTVDCSGDGTKADADPAMFKCDASADCAGFAATVMNWIGNDQCTGDATVTSTAYYISECAKTGDATSIKHECGSDAANKISYASADCTGNPSSTDSLSKTCEGGTAGEITLSQKASCEAASNGGDDADGDADGGDDEKDGCNFVRIGGFPYGIGKCQSFDGGEGSGKVACKDGKPEMTQYKGSSCSGDAAGTESLADFEYECGMDSACGSVPFTLTDYEESDCKGEKTSDEQYFVYECIPNGDGSSNLDCASDKFSMYTYSDAACSKDKETKAYASDECMTDSDQTVQCTAAAVDDAIDKDKSAAHSLTSMVALLVAVFAAFAQ